MLKKLAWEVGTRGYFNAIDVRSLAAVEPYSLKQYCRLAVLKYLQRERYNRISDLPLPKHLQVRH